MSTPMYNSNIHREAVVLELSASFFLKSKNSVDYQLEMTINMNGRAFHGFFDSFFEWERVREDQSVSLPLVSYM